MRTMAHAVSLRVIRCAAAFEMGIDTGSKDDYKAAEEPEGDCAAQAGGVVWYTRRIFEGKGPHFI